MSVEVSKHAISLSGSRNSQVGAKSDEARIFRMILETLPSRDAYFLCPNCSHEDGIIRPEVQRRSKSQSMALCGAIRSSLYS